MYKKILRYIVFVVGIIVIGALGYQAVVYYQSWKTSEAEDVGSNEVTEREEVAMERFVNSSVFYEPDELEVVVIVGDEFITNKDVEYYGSMTAFSMLTQDEVVNRLVFESQVIQGALDQEIIERADIPEGVFDTPDKSGRLRSGYVVDLVEEIEVLSNKGVDFEMVSIWFINTRFIYPGTVEEAKSIAYDKVRTLYDRVNSGELAMEEAGGIIAADTSLESIDMNYKLNAYQVREDLDVEKYRNDMPILFGALDDLAVGEMSDVLFEIDDVIIDDETVEDQEAICFFVRKLEKNDGGWYDFEDWFSTIENNYEVVNLQ